MNLIETALAIHLSLGSVGVIGGAVATPADAISKSIVKLGVCTGILIGERTVLTASHCMKSRNPFPYGVTYAADQSGLQCTRSYVEAISRPPGAVMNERGFTYPDLLLIKLGTRLCGAVPAMVGENPVGEGEVIRAAGYGIGSASSVLPTQVELRASPKDRGTIDALYADITPTMNPRINELKEEFRTYGTDHYDLALPVNQGESICSGDSGGPVFRNVPGSSVVELVGINGAIVGHELKGHEACHFGFLQLYSPVAKHLPWIREKSAKWDSQP